MRSVIKLRSLTLFFLFTFLFVGLPTVSVDARGGGGHRYKTTRKKSSKPTRKVRRTKPKRSSTTTRSSTRKSVRSSTATPRKSSTRSKPSTSSHSIYSGSSPTGQQRDSYHGTSHTSSSSYGGSGYSGSSSSHSSGGSFTSGLFNLMLLLGVGFLGLILLCYLGFKLLKFLFQPVSTEAVVAGSQDELVESLVTDEGEIVGTQISPWERLLGLGGSLVLCLSMPPVGAVVLFLFLRRWSRAEDSGILYQLEVLWKAPLTWLKNGGNTVLEEEFGPFDFQVESSEAVAGGSQDALISALRDGAVARLVKVDPNFSMPVFQDFGVLLFTRFHRALGKGMQFNSVAGYFDDQVVRYAEQETSDLYEITEVCVGNSELKSTRVHQDVVEIDVLFEATTLRESGGGGGNQMFHREKWTFSKQSGVLSQEPDTALSLCCPSCGSKNQLTLDGRCSYCEQKVNDGRFAWTVTKRQVLACEPAPSLELGDGGGVEYGTDTPTVFDPQLSSDLQELKSRDPEFQEEQFRQEVEECFLEVQRAWSELDEGALRALESESLFNTHRYWLARYRNDGLRNRLGDISISKIELVKVGSDKFYDSLTVRIAASMIDVTETVSGVIVSGTPGRPTHFTEYWTFIRRKTFEKAHDEGCPSCGAPIQVDDSGVCQYCDSRLTTGAFGWVLSQITQDEEYSG